MKKSKIIWGLIIICIILGIVIFFAFNKTTKDADWDIKIHEYSNNPLAGRRIHESRTLLIDSQKGVGKITYLDEKMEFKETKQFKVKKEDINKILQLTEKGETTNEKKSDEVYTVYEIEINTKIIYVDSKSDKENIISNLFID